MTQLVKRLECLRIVDARIGHTTGIMKLRVFRPDCRIVEPEHAKLHDTGRVTYTSINDAEALEAFHELGHLEGIIPALESAHAVAHAKKLKLSSDQIVVVNLSGRGDKDVTEVMRLMRDAH